jgi:NAD(P)-dependent dehydrogenase (short-subunit alcohol dehydrogenase family)
MQDFKDKVAVITGAANGIGLDIAKALIRQGCHVVVSDIHLQEAQARADQLGAMPDATASAIAIACDVTDVAQINALADKAWAHFGHVDALFNNAGVGGGMTPAVKTKEADLRWVFEVNFFGNWNTCMEFTRRFSEQGTPAHICNTASENSIGWPAPYMAGYNATKAAVLGYTGMLRMELPEAISISLLCPGWTQTEIANSGALRPETYGGPKPVRDTTPIEGDVTPYAVETVGAHTIEQIKQGAFYIFPHYAARHLAEERNDEISAAFDAQQTDVDDWQSHDTRTYFNRMIAAAQAKKGS